MLRRRSLSTVLLVLTAGAIEAHGDPAIDAVRTRFDRFKPDEKALVFYSLDWHCSLADARTAAAKQNRLILAILNTNISAHCNFYSGHT